MPRPTRRRGNPCGCPSPLLNRETGNRRSIHALPQFDKQEHMSHTIHKRLQAAHSHDNEEMARYGANTTKENHAASPTCSVPGAPGEAANFTITSKMQQNATPCNKFSKNPWRDGSSPLPAPPTTRHSRVGGNPCPGQPVVGAILVVALPRCSIEKQEITVLSTLFPNLTNKNACTTLSISGCQPPTLATTRKWRKMARYGANTTKENHAASPTCPVPGAPGEAANFTITRKMQQNATLCNKFSKNPWLDGPSPLPARPATRHSRVGGNPYPGQPIVGATLVVARPRYRPTTRHSRAGRPLNNRHTGEGRYPEG